MTQKAIQRLKHGSNDIKVYLFIKMLRNSTIQPISTTSEKVGHTDSSAVSI